jgi:hypothetical protein
MSSIARLVLASLILPGQQVGDGGPEAVRLAAARLEIMKSEAARYAFLDAPGGKAAATLHPEPLLRWTNPVAEEEDAALFLWTREGRPEAAAQFFVRKDNWMHEFQSLSARTFAVEWNGREVWSPEKPGLAFEAVPDAKPPARTTVQRSRQMREIAESFAASVDFNYDVKSRYELRLLPKPVHRYGGEGEPVEGAIWAFVQGTNPEALLLIEARRPTGADPSWQYAIAAMTSYPAEVTRHGKSVWKVGRQPIPTPTTTGVYLFRDHVPLRPKGD